MSSWAGVAVSDMLRWGSGRLFWAFQHLIAARPGSVLLLPDRKALGALAAAQEACPVPYEQVLAALDPALAWRPVVGIDAAAFSGFLEAHAMAGPGPWDAARLEQLPAFVLRHVGGLRLAIAQDLITLDFGRPA
jgi:hypothetical protein